MHISLRTPDIPAVCRLSLRRKRFLSILDRLCRHLIFEPDVQSTRRGQGSQSVGEPNVCVCGWNLGAVLFGSELAEEE